MTCKHQFQLQWKHRSAIAASLLLFLGIASDDIYADSDPQDFLQHAWYVVEVVVFEPVTELPSSEHLVHGLPKRTYPASIRSLTFAENEVMQAIARSSIVEPDPLDASNGLYAPDQTEGTNPSKGDSPSISTRQTGCWLHSPLFSFTLEPNDSKIATPSLRNEDDDTSNLFDDQEQTRTFLFESSRERDPTLPEWLPDDWESSELILKRAGRLLGLCDEEMQTLLRFERLSVHEVPDNEVQLPLTMPQVRAAFSDYETELLATVGTRRPDSLLNLQRTASRLRTEGYRVIGHAAWHQDALAPGTENSLLLQFGNTQLNGLYEIEGTLDLSVARFLHVDLKIWRTLPSSDETSREQSVEAPLLFYLIDESRRMALGETHYFDHPKFGILIQVRRLALPTNLEALVQELDG